MSAECYWCVTARTADPHPPLGTCSDCWVFACEVHAERDTVNVGKWVCFDGVARLVSAGAGLDDVTDDGDEPITSAAELTIRFPRLASETADERGRWRDDVARIAVLAEELSPHEQVSPEQVQLLAEAVGLVRHFLPARRNLAFEARPTGPRPRASGRLGTLVERL